MSSIVVKGEGTRYEVSIDGARVHLQRTVGDLTNATNVDPQMLIDAVFAYYGVDAEEEQADG